MDVPGANEERLGRIKNNLENTLSICHRARQTLDKTANGRVAAQVEAGRASMSARDYVELSSIEEYRKFKKMQPITKVEAQTIDFEELARRLSEG